MSTSRRLVTGAFGVFFIGLAGAIVLTVEGSMSLGTVLAAAAVGILGVEACISAVRGTRSLLERIGPLP